MNLHCIQYIHPNIAHKNLIPAKQILYDMMHRFHLDCMFYSQLHMICMFDPSHNILVDKQYKYLFLQDIQYICLMRISNIDLKPKKILFHMFYKHPKYLDSKFGNCQNILYIFNYREYNLWDIVGRIVGFLSMMHILEDIWLFYHLVRQNNPHDRTQFPHTNFCHWLFDKYNLINKRHKYFHQNMISNFISKLNIYHHLSKIQENIISICHQSCIFYKRWYNFCILKLLDLCKKCWYKHIKDH